MPEKQHEWQLVFGLLSMMEHARMEADSIRHNVAISACRDGSEWQLTLGLISRIAQVKMQDDSISYSAAASAREK